MTRPIFVGALVLKVNTVLLVRQAQGHTLGGKWTIPWGALEADEQPSDGAVREVREEAGLEVAAGELAGVQVIPPEWGFGIALLFRCEALYGTPEPDNRETDAARFLSLADIESLTEPVDGWSRWIVEKALSSESRGLRKHSGNPYEPSEGYF